MRQTSLLQYANGQKPNVRVTRGNSDLPKQQQKEIDISSSESEEQEQSQNQSSPKEKKIHHMTLKALERKKKLAELGIQNHKSNEGDIPKVPRKRGRPKGQITKKRVQKQQFQANIQEVIEANSETPKKKQLRKRENLRKIIDPDSQQMMIPQDVQQPKKEQKIKIQVDIVIKKPQQVGIIPANAPKKRGRKKKVNIQSMIQADNHSLVPLQPTQKTFTIPKSQTYDNYNKFYNKIHEQTKQSTHKQQPILIFDKFTNSQTYERLIKALK